MLWCNYNCTYYEGGGVDMILTDKQVIEKVIKIATENGWGEFKRIFGKYPSMLKLGLTPKVWGGIMHEYSSFDSIIFNHDFCKALFGEEGMCIRCGNIVSEGDKCSAPGKGYCCLMAGWEEQITQLALSEDRIDYLREWLNETKD